MEKIGVNIRRDTPKTTARFIIIDSKPHLNQKGVEFICNWTEQLILVTSNKSHPAFLLKKDYKNLTIIYYNEEIDFRDMMEKLKEDYKVERITIQSGGTLNGKFLKEGLLDYVNAVVAPLLVGEKKYLH